MSSIPPAYNESIKQAPMQGYPPPTRTFAVAPTFGPGPTRVTCPSCSADIRTTVCTETAGRAHLCCILMCLTGVLSCCSCLPYCMKSFEQTVHKCPSCHTEIGKYLEPLL